MKAIKAISVIILFSVSTYAQVIFEETFDNGLISNGWKISAQSSNWATVESNLAGGTPYECRMSWTPQFNGMTKLIYELDVTGTNQVGVRFKHFIDHYDGIYNVGLESNKNGSSVWNSEWMIFGPKDDTKETIWLNINTTNTNKLKLAWIFNGNSQNIDYWYLDDILVFVPYEHDVMLEKVAVPNQVLADSILTPKAVIRNIGKNSEDFEANCKIYNSSGEFVYNENVMVSGLAPNSYQQISFPDFNVNADNELFTVKVSTLLNEDDDTNNDSAEGYFNSNQIPRIVLWEEFTSTTCGPCAAANPNIKQVLAEYGKDKILSIFWHVWWPSPGNDPFYHLNTTDSKQRTTNYYKVSGVPDAVVDGFNGPSPGNKTDMRAKIDSRLNYFSAFTIDAAYKPHDDKYFIKTDITAEGGVIPGKYCLRIVAVENGLRYTGTNGESGHEYVMRKAYPDVNGIPVNIVKGETKSFSLNCELDPQNWNLDNLEVVVFLQNDDTKEVVQTTKAILNNDLVVGGIENSSKPKEYTLNQNYPNPFNPVTTINYNLPEAGFVKLNVVNSLGEIVETLINANQSAGTYNKEFDASKYGSGVYFYILNVNGFRDIKKMILLK